MRVNYDTVKKRFCYNSVTGTVFYRRRDVSVNASARDKQWNARFAFKPAGYVNNGYIRCSWRENGKTFSLYAHQIAFILMRGYLPEVIDHIDVNPLNNAFDNLRAASQQTNPMNCKKRSINSTGLKGVSWSKSNNCWRMDIRDRGVRYHSYHATETDAFAAYKLMSEKLHKEWGNIDVR
jgi:hypothetical protein